MIEVGVRTSAEPIEESLRARLARSDASRALVQPILRHLLDGAAHSSIFADEIVANVRGMLEHLAHRLLADASHGRTPASPEREAELAEALQRRPGLLEHLHASALEWQLAERLEQHYALDPVVSPLLQALIASPQAETQVVAMTLLAAQARWCQGQRRMQLAPAELPDHLLAAASAALREVTGEGAADAGRQVLHDDHREAAARLHLATRLVTGLGNAAAAALDVRHAGAALFVTALAMGSGQSRDAAMLSMHHGDALRLALGLRAAGLSVGATQQQLVVLHGDMALPAGFDRLSTERAGVLLAVAAGGEPMK